MPSFGRIAADTNVILSAAVAGAARWAFAAPSLLIFTTDFNLAEVKKYLPDLAERYGLELAEVSETLENLPLQIYGHDRYESHIEEARRYLANRDPDDVALAALALKLEIPIWSNDNDFQVVPLEFYTTAGCLRRSASE